MLHQQRSVGYEDVAGARASVTLPISDRLVSRLVAENIPASAPVRELDLRAAAQNRFAVRVRLSRPAILPPITVHLSIERQPNLPADPIFVLRLLSTGLLSFAGPALRFLDVLPSGIAMQGDHLIINVRTLLEQRGLAEYLDFVEHLEVTTEEGRFVVSGRGRVPPAVR